jgi:hypothetical protein
MARFEVVAAVLLAAMALSPGPAMAVAQDDALPKLEAFRNVDHFAADPAGSYKGVADSRLHSRLNHIVDGAAGSLASAIRKGKPDQELLHRLAASIQQIKRRDLEAKDAEKVVEAYSQLFALAGLSHYDGVLSQWLFDYDTHREEKEVPQLWDIESGNSSG